MAQTKKDALALREEEREERPPRTGFLGLLGRLSDRLTQGFWEEIARGLARANIRLGEEFLSVLLFLGFSGLCALACLSEFPAGVRPVPLALAAALGGYRLEVGRREVSAFGLCASCVLGILISLIWMPQGGASFLCLGALFVFRLFTSGGRFCEGVLWRVMLAGVFSALQELFYRGFSDVLFSPVSLLSAVLFGAALTALFSGVFVHASAKGKVSEKGPRAVSFRLLPSQLALYRTLSLGALLFCALRVVGELRLLSFSPAMLLASLGVLLLVRYREIKEAVLAAVILGFAAGGEHGVVALSAAAIAASLGFSHSCLFGTCLSFLSSASFLLGFCSASAFALCGADLLVAHVLFFLLAQALDARALRTAETPPQTSAARSALQEKLTRLSEAFGSLSEVFYMATDHALTPEGELAARLVREASERVCASCRHSTDCWEQNYGLTHCALEHVSRVLVEKRSVTPEELEPYFKSRCVKAEELCEEIGRRYAAECGAMEMREMPASLLCGEYASVSRLLSEEAQGLLEEEEVNHRLTLAAEEVLRERKISYRAAYVTGGRNACLTVTGLCLPRLSLSTQELTDAFSARLKMPFEVPEFLSPLEDSTLRLRRKRKVRLSCAKLVRAAGAQPVSGDTTGFFESDMGYFYSLICDGMGSGRGAAFTSRLSSIFIEKLLTFSHEKGITLEMLNRFLLSQKEERFSTVDLLEVDFYTAHANFIKAGAAASYIKRGTGLYRIASKTPPAGILGTLSAEQTSLSLSDGDCIVMFSDGVVPSEETDAWFAEALAFSKERDARGLASYLMEEACRHHGADSDDMSICVLEVHAA